MAAITPDTFDPLKRYVSVRLQQGVPLVDADWNAVDDTRRYELRSFVRWYVGNGVPNGQDGFKIAPVGATDDFRISAGISGPVDALANAGRCFVDGREALITADVNFKAQPLHVSQAGAGALAARLGVPTVAAVVNGNLTIYLDVWERLVTAAEDPGLVVPAVGVESCARIKREWAVRVRNAATVPQPGDADYIAGHGYYALASCAHAGGGQITAASLTDLREQQLLVPPATLAEDLFGTDPHDYRRGVGRPAISLREAINSLLRGEVPATDAAAIAPDPGLDTPSRAFVLDGAGGLVAFWRSDRTAATDQVYVSRLDLGTQPYQFGPATAVTSGALRHGQPSAARLPNGDIAVVFASGLGGSSDIAFRRGSVAALPGIADTPVAATAGVLEDMPIVLVSGTSLLFVYRARPAATFVWRVRRYDLGTSSFPGAATDVFPGGTTPTGEGHAAVDTAGNVWLAAEAQVGAGRVIAAAQLSPLGATLGVDNTTLDSGATSSDLQPFVLPLANGDVRVFWHAESAAPASSDGIWTGVHTSGAWQKEQVPDTDATSTRPSAVEDADGGIWLFWVSRAGGAANGTIEFRYRDPKIASWGPVHQLIGPASDNDLPFPILDPSGAMWVIWSGDENGNYDLWFKRLVLAL